MIEINGYKCAIFDLDGTLIDSMPFWHDISDKYLIANGIKIEETVWEEVKRLTLIETAEYFQNQFGIKKSTEEICNEVRKMVLGAYSNDIPLKNGALDLLENFYKQNIPCVLATASDRKCVDSCIERLGIKKYFKEILTCMEYNTSKYEPLIFLKSAEVCNAKPNESIVFEDAIHCIKTAKKAGFNVCAVYDESAEEIDSTDEQKKSDWEKILDLTTTFIK